MRSSTSPRWTVAAGGSSTPTVATCARAHIVDALGWRRVLGPGENVQPPDARLSRGLEVHPSGTGDELELWITPRYVSPGYGWSFPAGDEVRVGVGSFDPRLHVKQPTLKLVEDVRTSPEGFQGNWIPHSLRPAAEDGVLFVGDSAGHCLPLSAEGIRTALYFGVAAGASSRRSWRAARPRPTRSPRYARFSASHALEVPLDVLRPAGGAPAPRPPDGRPRPPLRPPRPRALGLRPLPRPSRHRSSCARRRRQRATTGSRRRRSACRVLPVWGAKRDTRLARRAAVEGSTPPRWAPRRSGAP